MSSTTAPCLTPSSAVTPARAAGRWTRSRWRAPPSPCAAAMTYPDTITIKPLTNPAENALVRVPGSKSITNRALVLAALSKPDQGSELRGVLQSEDTEVMIAALRDLGFGVRTDWDAGCVQVSRAACASRIPVAEADLFVANSGTTMRFLT